MTVRKTPAQKVRAKLINAAKRSLGLIAASVAEHQAALDKGEIPDGRFSASAAKYDQTLASLVFLGEFGEAVAGGDQDDGLTEVRRSDLAALTGLVAGAWPQMAESTDSPLARLAAAAEDPPFDTAPQDSRGKE